MTSLEPRIAPGNRAQIGTVNFLFARISGRVTGTNPPNLFLTLGRHRKLFRGWLRFAGRLMPGGKLPRRETEMVILRVAQLADCQYELSHHQHLARRAGLSVIEVERVAQGPDAEGWTDRERVLLRAVDELHSEHNLSDDTWGQVRTHLDEVKSIELVFLVAHYQMLATGINTLRLNIDQPRKAR